MRPHRRQPTRLPRPWDSPGKNTGVGCHFLLQCMKVRSKSEITQSCPTLSDPMDCSPPGSSIHGIFQARVLQWGAIAFSTTPLKLLSQNQITVTLLNPVVNSNAHFGLNELILVSRIVYLIPWVHAKLLQSHPTLCDPIDCSPPSSSVHGISQARILEWVAIPSSRGSF